MAGLLLGCVALPGSLGGLPLQLAKKGALHPQEHQQHLHHQHLKGSASAFVVAAACDGLSGQLGGAGGAASTQMTVSNPPRTRSHTRRLVVPAYCLAGTHTRRRHSGRGGSDDELDGGDGGGFWGGGGGDGGDGFWGGDWGSENEDEGGSLARLQDIVLLWTVFCALAFCQTLYHVSPCKPKAVAPAFAALSYTGLKATLLRGGGTAVPALATAS